MSTNGLLSFRSPFGSPRVENFTNSFTRFGDPIVAPYWRDLEPEELRGRGNIFTRITNDADLLNETAALIESLNPGITGFRPQQAVIVTFERVAINGLNPFRLENITVSASGNM